MGMDYELIDHTADLGFRVQKASADEVVRASVAALCDIITPVCHVRARCSSEIEVEAEDYPGLLHSLLEEVLFRFEVAAELLPHVETLALTEPVAGERSGRLTVVLGGERLDLRRHEIDRVVKAITLHGLRFEPRDAGGWMAQVILDL